MQLSRLGEFGLIDHFRRLTHNSPKVFIGIGDDSAAVRPPKENHLLLLTCDPVIEGIHFDSSATPYQIGWKAMARNLSDIAAMGGIPLYALISASLPKRTTLAKALGIYRGLHAAAKTYDVDIVGGDTSRNEKKIHLSVTIIGEIPKKEVITRSRAKPSHLLCVTGTLGASILGKHLFFKPRLSEARFLAKTFRPSAMMDISDGLASDLRRLSEQSRVGFEVWSDQLPISPALRAQKLSQSQNIQHAMQDGEDYELLFTIDPGQWASLQSAWKKRFRLKLTIIGKVRHQSFGIRLIEYGRQKTPQPKNDHFRK